MRGEAGEEAGGAEKGGRNQDSGRDKRQKEREKGKDGRKEGSAVGSPRGRERAHAAVGVPPDSARGLFIEILAFRETMKQLQLGQIRNKTE